MFISTYSILTALIKATFLLPGNQNAILLAILNNFSRQMATFTVIAIACSSHFQSHIKYQ